MALPPPKGALETWLDTHGVNLDWEAKSELEKAIAAEFEKMTNLCKSFSRGCLETAFRPEKDGE